MSTKDDKKAVTVKAPKMSAEQIASRERAHQLKVQRYQIGGR